MMACLDHPDLMVPLDHLDHLASLELAAPRVTVEDRDPRVARVFRDQEEPLVCRAPLEIPENRDLQELTDFRERREE